MVSSASLACMAVSTLVVFTLPFAAVLVARRRGLAMQIRPVLVGAVVFILFALVLERLLHTAVFSVFPQIQTIPVAYMLYGALAAGVFEEGGRACGFTLLRRMKGADNGLPCAIGYGAGHAGAEAILLVGFGLISNIMVAMTLNAPGGMDTLMASVPEASRELATAQLQGLIDAAPASFLLAGFERIVAFALQLSLSVVVWMAVSGRLSKAWIGGAVLLHALSDCGAALYQAGAASMLVAELCTVAVTVAVVGMTIHLYRQSASTARA